MSKQLINWLIFTALSFVWGSSFILMKFGMRSLTAYQVASIRIIAAGTILSPIALRYLKNIPLKKLGLTFLSGLFGSLIPSFLFCLAESRIDSALAGTINSLTPVFAIICGAVLFNYKIPSYKVLGILVAFSGSILLLFSEKMKENNDLLYTGYVILATVFYGINVNLVHKYLYDMSSLKIAAIGLFLCSIPASVILYFTGYFNFDFNNYEVIKSTAAAIVLGLGGTAFASIFFFVLIKRAGVIFASMVTYGIPFVAIFWGLVINEKITWKQILSLVIILTGIYMANKAPKAAAIPD